MRCLSDSPFNNTFDVKLYPSVCLSLSVCLPACLPVCLSVCLSDICLSILFCSPMLYPNTLKLLFQETQFSKTPLLR